MAQRITQVCKKSPDYRRSIDQAPNARCERLVFVARASIKESFLIALGDTKRSPPDPQLNHLSLRNHAHLNPL